MHSRFSLVTRGLPENDFANDVRRGLTASQKFLLPLYFYDELGSALFDAICRLPEYYVTRAETEILETYASEIAEELGGPLRIVELGSGRARKTRLLIEAVLQRQKDLEFVPVDVDAIMLERAGDDLLPEFPSLTVHAICSDFRSPAATLSDVLRPDRRNAVLFLGSTIGNLSFDEAVSMISGIRSLLREEDRFLLGADLRKSRTILEPAYDDALGVTAAFNLNLLLRINRELRGNFHLDRFRHRAIYDEQQGRIEMHLVSLEKQQVSIEKLGMCVEFAEGESIHTENSYKYDAATLERIAKASGFKVVKMWTDSREWFADVLMR